MNYQMQSRQDTLTGNSLVVSIPEEELDRKAFYTLQNSIPPFLVPFSDRTSEGKKVLSYHLDGYSKLRYFYGEKTPESYIQMWESLLQPLLDCRDWFLDPFCLFLEEDHLYQSKGGVISYLYLPTRTPCTNYDGLRSVMVRIAKNNHVGDPKIENIVLSMLVQDFRPENLLDALRKARTPGRFQVSVTPQDRYPAAERRQETRQQPEPAPVPEEKPAAFAGVPEIPPPIPVGEGEIIIDLSGMKEKQKKQSRFSLFGHKDKGEREERATKRGKKGREKREKGGVRMPEIPQAQAAPPQQMVAPVYEPPCLTRVPEAESDETQLEDSGPRLKLVGRAGLPMVISVNIQEGETFTIGRYDITVGRQQSSFEFQENTKAVSRHHAAIERDMEGYTITDIQSRAGTFLNGGSLRPGVPYRLRQNMRISFGNSGADYLWEE